VRVLLCTDNPEVRRYMRSRGIICAQPPLISRDKYLQALFEMMLLSSCDLVIGRSLSLSLARAPSPPNPPPPSLTPCPPTLCLSLVLHHPSP
jgi:hypothetical protein